MPRDTDQPSPRDQEISIRASRRQRDLIDHAAAALGTTRSAFVLDAACREAERVLLDRTHFRLDDDAFARLEALLEAPPPPSDGLLDLLRRKAPWG